MEGYRLNYVEPFYYLEKKILILWIFKYWHPVLASHSLTEMEEEINKLKNVKSNSDKGTDINSTNK
jgi:hypothetical protein